LERQHPITGLVIARGAHRHYMITPTKLIGGLDTFINPTKRGAERRIGDWRLVYIIDDAARVVTITRIAHRREVYD
jgi:hypothetical protein